jgi:hypothetical protein
MSTVFIIPLFIYVIQVTFIIMIRIASIMADGGSMFPLRNFFTWLNPLKPYSLLIRLFQNP